MSRTENIDMRDLTCQDTVVNFSRTRLFQKKQTYWNAKRDKDLLGIIIKVIFDLFTTPLAFFMTSKIATF